MKIVKTYRVFKLYIDFDLNYILLPIDKEVGTEDEALEQLKEVVLLNPDEKYTILPLFTIAP